MEELIDRMNKLLANSYSLYLKAHFYHWNTFGQDFPQFHDFFGDFYEEVYGSIDTLAEFIRAMDGTPQNSISMLKQNSTLTEVTSPKNIPDSVEDIQFDVQVLIKDVLSTMDMADKFREVGLSNYLQERHAAYKKHAWMLKSILKK